MPVDKVLVVESAMARIARIGLDLDQNRCPFKLRHRSHGRGIYFNYHIIGTTLAL